MRDARPPTGHADSESERNLVRTESVTTGTQEVRREYAEGRCTAAQKSSPLYYCYYSTLCRPRHALVRTGVLVYSYSYFVCFLVPFLILTIFSLFL